MAGAALFLIAAATTMRSTVHGTSSKPPRASTWVSPRWRSAQMASRSPPGSSLMTAPPGRVSGPTAAGAVVDCSRLGN